MKRSPSFAPTFSLAKISVFAENLPQISISIVISVLCWYPLQEIHTRRRRRENPNAKHAITESKDLTWNNIQIPNETRIRSTNRNFLQLQPTESLSKQISGTQNRKQNTQTITKRREKQQNGTGFCKNEQKNSGILDKTSIWEARGVREWIFRRDSLPWTEFAPERGQSRRSPTTELAEKRKIVAFGFFFTPVLNT